MSPIAWIDEPISGDGLAPAPKPSTLPQWQTGPTSCLQVTKDTKEEGVIRFTSTDGQPTELAAKITLANNSFLNRMAFKIKSNAPKGFLLVKPGRGILDHRQAMEVTLIMNPNLTEQGSPDLMKVDYKLLVQSIVLDENNNAQDVWTPELWHKVTIDSFSLDLVSRSDMGEGKKLSKTNVRFELTKGQNVTTIADKDRNWNDWNRHGLKNTNSNWPKANQRSNFENFAASRQVISTKFQAVENDWTNQPWANQDGDQNQNQGRTYQNRHTPESSEEAKNGPGHDCKASSGWDDGNQIWGNKTGQTMNAPSNASTGQTWGVNPNTRWGDSHQGSNDAWGDHHQGSNDGQQGTNDGCGKTQQESNDGQQGTNDGWGNDQQGTNDGWGNDQQGTYDCWGNTQQDTNENAQQGPNNDWNNEQSNFHGNQWSQEQFSACGDFARDGHGHGSHCEMIPTTSTVSVNFVKDAFFAIVSAFFLGLIIGKSGI